MDTDSFVFSEKTTDLVGNLQNRNDIFDFSNLKNIMKYSVR